MNSLKRETFIAYLYLLPFLIVYIVFLGYPIIYSLYISFHKNTIYSDWYDVFSDMKFVGLQHYIDIVQDKKFWWSLIASGIYAILTIPTGIAVSLLLALLLNNKLKFTSAYRSAYFLPNVLDLLVIGLIWTLLLSPKYGLIDYLLNKIGITYFSENTILDNKYLCLPAIAIALVLKAAGFGMVLFLTAIHNISEAIYEAADIDGCNWWQKTIYITLPLVKPIIIFMLITGTIGALNAFTEIYAMTNNTGGPPFQIFGETVSVASLSGYYLYKNFVNTFYGRAAAISYCLLIITVIISIINMKIVGKENT